MRSFLWAACGTCFTFLMTALGAALVFCLKNQISERMNRLCLGFAGGVMSAAAVFSLLVPAMERAEALSRSPIAAAALGFVLGACVMTAIDMLLQRRGKRPGEDAAQRRRTLLFSAVTLHNIPEGMAVGLAFSTAAQDSGAAFAAACALALGIGVQNIPEGAAIALPLRQSGVSRLKSFGLGALSGAVEPLCGVLAVLIAAAAAPVMPMLMSAAAGAMMWVVMAEMLPQAGQGRDGVLAALAGYALMMVLDVGLG